MRAVAYANKFLRARGGGNNFKNLDSLLGLKPVLVPPKFLGMFTPLITSVIYRHSLCYSIAFQFDFCVCVCVCKPRYIRYSIYG